MTTLNERELLIDTEDYSMGKDALFVNKNNLPIMDIVYDLCVKVYNLKEKEQECEKYKKALDEVKVLCNKTCQVCSIFKKCDKEYRTCRNAKIINIIDNSREDK